MAINLNSNNYKITTENIKQIDFNRKGLKDTLCILARLASQATYFANNNQDDEKSNNAIDILAIFYLRTHSPNMYKLLQDASDTLGGIFDNQKLIAKLQDTIHPINTPILNQCKNNPIKLEAILLNLSTLTKKEFRDIVNLSPDILDRITTKAKQLSHNVFKNLGVDHIKFDHDLQDSLKKSTNPEENSFGYFLTEAVSKTLSNKNPIPEKKLHNPNSKAIESINSLKQDVNIYNTAQTKCISLLEKELNNNEMQQIIGYISTNHFLRDAIIKQIEDKKLDKNRLKELITYLYKLRSLIKLQNLLKPQVLPKLQSHEIEMDFIYDAVNATPPTFEAIIPIKEIYNSYVEFLKMPASQYYFGYSVIGKTLYEVNQKLIQKDIYNNEMQLNETQLYLVQYLVINKRLDFNTAINTVNYKFSNAYLKIYGLFAETEITRNELNINFPRDLILFGDTKALIIGKFVGFFEQLTTVRSIKLAELLTLLLNDKFSYFHHRLFFTCVLWGCSRVCILKNLPFLDHSIDINDLLRQLVNIILKYKLNDKSYVEVIDAVIRDTSRNPEHVADLEAIMEKYCERL